MPGKGQRGRDRGRRGVGRWVGLGVVLLLVMGLTFGVGVLVGGHRARHAHPAVAAESPRKPAQTSRRGGLTESGAEKPTQPQEKLTFYQTLKAPLGPVRVSDGASAQARPANAQPSHGKAPERSSEGAPSKTVERSSDGTPSRMLDRQGQEAPAIVTAQSRYPGERDEPRGGSSAAKDGARPDATAEWTVQVGVFSSPQQAAGVKKQLAQGGWDAQVAPTTGSDGLVRYRVRLGAFRSKEEADRTAERVRSDRSLPTFVTIR